MQFEQCISKVNKHPQRTRYSHRAAYHHQIILLVAGDVERGKGRSSNAYRKIFGQAKSVADTSAQCISNTRKINISFVSINYS